MVHSATAASKSILLQAAAKRGNFFEMPAFAPSPQAIAMTASCASAGKATQSENVCMRRCSLLLDLLENRRWRPSVLSAKLVSGAHRLWPLSAI
jgi:hypothetical protein